MKYNYVFALIASSLGIFLSTFPFSQLDYVPYYLIIHFTIIITLSLSGLLGIYLFERNYKLCIIQYLLCGFLMIISLNSTIITGIIYLMAAGIAYFVKDKSGRKIYNSFEDIRVYCNDNVLSNNYKGFYEILNDKKLNLIPILSFASIVLIVLSCITLCYMDETNKSGSLDIHDMNSSLNHNYGNYMGEFSADLSSPQNMDIQKIVGIWYDDNGNEIYTSSNNMNNILLYENTKLECIFHTTM
jgi:hypothetical protein